MTTDRPEVGEAELAGLDVERLAEAIAAADLNLAADDPTRALWRSTPAQLEQASRVAAEYALSPATPEPPEAGR